MRVIPKSELVDGEWYEGRCRNASRAKWDAHRQVFTYDRHKFGHVFVEDIEHVEDEKGFDTFKPHRKESE